MHLTKALGLAAMTAVAAMAFVGTSTAFGQTHEIVLCKELVALCPAGKLWPSGTKLLLLAPGTGGQAPVFLGTLNAKCEDSTGTAETTAEIGAILPVKIPALAFGQLPKPELGKGCTNCTEIHVTLPIAGQIEVEAVDKYFLKTTFKLAHLCPFIGTCVLEAKNVKVPILHTGKHSLHSGENLALIEFQEVILVKVEGPGLCGNESKFDADYVIHLADPPLGEPGLVWPSLDKKV